MKIPKERRIQLLSKTLKVVDSIGSFDGINVIDCEFLNSEKSRICFSSLKPEGLFVFNLNTNDLSSFPNEKNKFENYSPCALYFDKKSNKFFMSNLGFIYQIDTQYGISLKKIKTNVVLLDLYVSNNYFYGFNNLPSKNSIIIGNFINDNKINIKDYKMKSNVVSGKKEKLIKNEFKKKGIVGRMLDIFIKTNIRSLNMAFVTPGLNGVFFIKKYGGNILKIENKDKIIKYSNLNNLLEFNDIEIFDTRIENNNIYLLARNLNKYFIVVLNNKAMPIKLYEVKATENNKKIPFKMLLIDEKTFLVVYKNLKDDNYLLKVLSK